jgi:hypothetical protein
MPASKAGTANMRIIAETLEQAHKRSSFQSDTRNGGHRQLPLQTSLLFEGKGFLRACVLREPLLEGHL